MPEPKTMTRSERSKRGAEERWRGIIPKATHSGMIKMAGQELHCDVLSDGRRILRQKTLLNAMGRQRTGGWYAERGNDTKTPGFLVANNLSPYLEGKILECGNIVNYKSQDGRKLIGYEAELLPEVCKVYVKADDDGNLKGKQKDIAQVCRIMLYGLASVGITALIDEDTGYEFAKQKNDLQILLEQFISKDLLPWKKKFHEDFFEQAYRLHGWQWPKVNKNLHPDCLGNFINKYVYKKISPEVWEELNKENARNENGNRSYRHHQKLTSDGQEALTKQIVKVTTAMKLSENMDQFKDFMEKC